MAVVTPLLKPTYSGTPRFIDASGQWTLLRGVNIQGDAGAATQNAVVACGGNMARIVVHWDQGESTAPSGTGTAWDTYTHAYNATYLGNIEAMVSLFASHGIFVQIDSHQASWSPSAKFNGFGGIPAWYYDVAKFPGNAAWTSCSTASNQAGCTIAKFWTETACAQTFYIAWWQELIRRFSAHANVVMYQVFNEPNPGTLGGTSLSKTNTMQSWLAPVVTAMHAADGQRAIAVMNRGGGQGYGTANYTAFGGSAGLQSKNMVIEHHSYYTGLAPGFPASAAGDIGYNAAGDDYFPNSAVCHNTTTGASYTGHEAWQDAYYGVPIAKAQQMGVPLFLGEFGVQESDPGRLQYINQMQLMIDAHQLDATVWEMAPTTSGLNLMSASGGTLNEMGQKWQTWFQATDFTPVGGGGGGGGGGTLSTNPTNASTVPNFYDPSFTAGSHKGRVEDIVQVAGVVYVAGAFTNVIDVDGADYTQFSYLCAHRADTGAVIKTWIGGFDARVRKLLVADNGNQIYAVGDFNNAGGSPRHGLARFTALTGPTDTSGITLNLNPGDVSADGSIYDLIVDLPNNRAWVTGSFNNIGGVARRGIAKFTIAAGSGWSVDTAFNATTAPFVGGGTGRALALKPDGTKLVAGWFPGNNGTDVSAVDSITAHDPNTGSAAAWLNPVNYNVTNEEHPGVYEMAGDINGVYITGLHNGGNSVTYYQWNGGGPNALTSQSGQTSDGGSFNAYWYRSCDGNCQSIELISNAGSTLVAVGHHGDVVANAPNVPSGTLGSPGPSGNSTSHGLFTCIAGPTGGQEGGYGGPPNFTSPSGTGDNLKLWAVYQEPASGDLLVGGDFTAVNSSAGNTYQRYARFQASGGGNSWSPAPSLDDPTPAAGETINVDTGTLTGATGYTIQWQRSPDGSSGSWVDISGQTSSAYVVAGTVGGTGDVGFFLRAQVVGATPSGNQTQYATATGAVQPVSGGPTNTAPPVVSPSPAAANQTLTTTNGTWTGSSLTFGYVWQRRNVATGTVAAISGASGNTYVTNSTTDVGNQVRSRITATDSTGATGVASSAWVDVGTPSSGSAVIYYTSDGHQSNVTKNYPLHGTGADLFVYGGDTYARGTAADFTADVTGLYGTSGRDILAKTVILCGNHDWANRNCAGGYLAYIAGLPQHAGFQGGKDYGKLTVAGWDLIFLNTNRAASSITGDCSETATLVSDGSMGIDATQLSWLNTQLAAPGTKKIVFGHQMYLSAAGPGDHPESAMGNLSAMWSALQGKTLAYIHGHWHGYWRMRPRDGQKRVASDAGFVTPGVVDIAAGTAGEGNYQIASTYPAKYLAATRSNPASPAYGYLKIGLNGDVATIQFMDQDGTTVVDTFTFTATGGGGGGGVGPSGGHPTVSDTTPTVGQTISCNSGSWSGTQPFDFAFSWENSLDSGLTWQPAQGAGATNAVLNVGAASTTSDYVVDRTDLHALLRCNVTVSNTTASAPARTAATAAVIDSVVGGQKPLVVSQPTIIPSTNITIGTNLVEQDGTWSGDQPISFARTWWRVPSVGARVQILDGTGNPVTDQTYVAQPSDVGYRIVAVVVATNTAGSTTSNMNPTSAVSAGIGFSLTDVIDTPDNQTITTGTPFQVIWEGHTDAPGGIVTSQISIDGGAWINGTQIADDGAGGGTWSYTFATLPAGVHTINTRDIANTV